MKRDKLTQIIALAIFSPIILALPFFTPIYHKPLYYLFFTILILLTFHKIIYNEKYEQKFYDKWQKAREQGFWINVARDSVKGFVQIFVIVILGQFLGNGSTPLDVFYHVPNNVLFGLSLFLIGFSFLLGIIAWHEKEKRYSRIYLGKATQQETI